MQQQEKKTQLSRFLNNVKISRRLNKIQYQSAQHLYDSGCCRLLSTSADEHTYLVHDAHSSPKSTLLFDDTHLQYRCECGAPQLCSHVYAAALQAYQDLSSMQQVARAEQLRYSRDGMIKRVLKERQERAAQEAFTIHFADNKYGEHLLENDKGKAYRLSFYDFTAQLGYCSCPDYQTNKLSTCKHLMYAFKAFTDAYPQHDKMAQAFPFVDIFCHPKHDYRISWYYPQELPQDIAPIIRQYFDEQHLFKPEALSRLHIFLEDITQHKLAKVRQEVREQAALHYQEAHIAQVSAKLPQHLAQTLLHAALPFQQEGIRWITSKRACILADEIGLGKSVQALGAALHKLRLFDLSTLSILCPAALHQHWHEEINHWVPVAYHSHIHLFNFEDSTAWPLQTDILIIDEAQKIQDYKLSVLSHIQSIEYQQMILITDSKLETSLIKFYTMVGLFDKHLLNPLWELSYQHCLFDAETPDKIVGYYQMDKLKERLTKVYLRREREEVIEQLPKAPQILIPVAMSASLRQRFNNKAKQAIKILQTKHNTDYDISHLRELLHRLIKLSTYNFVKDASAHDIPKLQEFIHFVQHKIQLRQQDKAVVFVDNTNLQHQLLRQLHDLGLEASMSAEDLADTSNQCQYLVTSEDLQQLPNLVQHYIYLALPKQATDLQARQEKIEKEGEGFQQARIYIFQTRNSLEELLYQWSNGKPHYLHQLLHFVADKGHGSMLSAPLQDSLMKSLQHYSQGGTKAMPPQQMSLFAEMAPASPTPPQAADNSLQHEAPTALEAFSKEMIALYRMFTKLDSHSKKLLFEGDYESKEMDDGLHIILKKREIDNKS